MKICYDLLLLGAFAFVKPPEERGHAGEAAPLTGIRTVKV